VQVIGFLQDCFKRHGAHCSLAEQPKVGELQMDWLRSEDLKEEKVITTSALILAVLERKKSTDQN